MTTPSSNNVANSAEQQSSEDYWTKKEREQ